MDKKNNMKQAMYEMFGVGAAPAEKAVLPTQTVPTPSPKAPASYLAPGTVMEGTLRCVGDVEIAGNFKGDITTEGTVILHANIHGNLSVRSLDLSGCKLVGDVVAGDMVTVSEDSEICGNVTAKELQCAGRITGDLKISGNMALAGTAQIHGNISTGSISVVRGAVMNGSIEIKRTQAPDKAVKSVQPGIK